MDKINEKNSRNVFVRDMFAYKVGKTKSHTSPTEVKAATKLMSAGMRLNFPAWPANQETDET